MKAGHDDLQERLEEAGAIVLNYQSLDIEVNFLTHIAKHISSSGAGIRMYMDIAVFIRHLGEKRYTYLQGRHWLYPVA